MLNCLVSNTLEHMTKYTMLSQSTASNDWVDPGDEATVLPASINSTVDPVLLFFFNKRASTADIV